MTESTDPTNHAEAFRSGASRRTMLKAAGLATLVGGGAALAACSSPTTTPTPDGSSAPSSSAPATSPEASPSASSAPSSPAAASSSASAAAPSGPSVTTADVPVGGGFIMPDADYVVTQPTKGSYKAFSKICTHQGCPVSQIADKEIVCRCHGSHFSITDGSVVSGPAQSPLPEAKTTVSGTKVVIST